MGKESPVPGIPKFVAAPRLPNDIDAPRGPIDQDKPPRDRFIRSPGASLIERRKRSAMLSRAYDSVIRSGNL